ncbi:dipeptide epimerase [Galbibacter orientalis]|uniref:Dipeptide epimerase n=1 Tax=Galbibacter orientalis DSM 19592 TaxID=926559 RepID=I3C960_9FLAO|nr:dipeptide epimerase [Galbibacter orientalis]EIJ40153.1 enolase superfamily enzyme related to L-alanine-DL-glutamate epimerase [Galbibacter orientalis DSM 19592]
MEISLKKYVLELEHTFSISRESHDFQDSLVVGLSLNGKTGYGEATANPYYKITVDSMMKEIKAIETEINNYNLEKPEDFHAFLKEKGLSNFAICALDLACHDLYGKLLGKPLYKIWGTTPENYPITNYTIGIDTVDKMVAKMIEKPWPLYKVKLGTDNDIEIVKQLRKNTDAIFRIDANNAWTPEQTLEFAPQLKELGVEFLEQPLPADNLAGYKEIVDTCVLPIIADESCIVEEDVDKCAGHFTGINIKLTKCGGLTPALRMIKRARELNLKVMVGCMTESSVGISAIAQLTPQLDYVDMDGAMLLKHDIAKGIEILEDGKLVFPTLGGSGVTLL